MWGEGVSCRLLDREGEVVVELMEEGKEGVDAGGSSGGLAVARLSFSPRFWGSNLTENVGQKVGKHVY